MKKIVLGLLSLIFMATPASALAATLSVSPPTGTFNQGCNFSVNVLVDTAGVITDGTDAVIKYDPARLTANAPVIIGTIYPEYPIAIIDVAKGEIKVSGIASSSQSYSGSGVLATINFTVANSGTPTALTFDFDPNNKGTTTDSNVVEKDSIRDVLSSVTNGSYTLGTNTCASQTATPGNPGGAAPRGAVSTPSATQAPLPDAGSETLTYTLAIVGSVLTVLGILGLALL